MDKKKMAKEMLQYYFMIVTLVNVAIYVLGMIFRPDTVFGYEAFLAPLCYGLLGILPFLIMYSRRELTVKEVVVRKILQLVLLEIVLLVVGLGPEQWGDIRLVLSFMGSVLVIYVLVHLFSWLIEWREARDLTDSLKRFQESKG